MVNNYIPIRIQYHIYISNHVKGDLSFAYKSIDGLIIETESVHKNSAPAHPESLFSAIQSNL